MTTVFSAILPTKCPLRKPFCFIFNLKIVTLTKINLRSKMTSQRTLFAMEIKGEMPFTSKRNLTFNLLDCESILRAFKEVIWSFKRDF